MFQCPCAHTPAQSCTSTTSLQRQLTSICQKMLLRKALHTPTCNNSSQPAQAQAPTPALTRRTLMTSCIALTPLLTQLNTPQHVGAAELQQAQTPTQLGPSAAFTTTADEPACASCVGYVDGTLGSCSAVEDPCSSSYDDRPAHFVAPWSYDGSTTAAVQRLVDTLEGCGARVQQRTSDYVYAVLDPDGSGRSLDLEFVFALNDNTVALRAAQRTSPPAAAAVATSGSSNNAAAAAVALPVNTFSSLLSQLGFSKDDPSRVLEDLRMQLGWEVVPILRNRQRLFLFGESPFDSFGPVAPPVPDYSRDLSDF